MTTDVQLRTQTSLPSLLILAPPSTHTQASAHTHAQTHTYFHCYYCQYYLLYANGGERELRTKDADLMVAMCSQILQSRDRLLREVGRSSGLVSLCTASSLTQAWSCREGGKGGDSGAGYFPGPPHSLFLLEPLLLPNRPECSTNPALNASFPCLFPRYWLQVLAKREKGIAKQLQAAPRRQPLDEVALFFFFFFSGVPLFPKRRNRMAPVDTGELCNAYH